uniref:Uncharacterized protein n=1 Tax=viral metagenome TaxID=1070528 RepID=A0A6C0BA73_9ZZZZ
MFNYFYLAPFIQILSIIYLVYLVLFLKVKILLPFFILYGLQAILDRQSYYEKWKTEEKRSYDISWYNTDLAHIITSFFCIIVILYRMKT